MQQYVGMLVILGRVGINDVRGEEHTTHTDDMRSLRRADARLKQYAAIARRMKKVERQEQRAESRNAREEQPRERKKVRQKNFACSFAKIIVSKFVL